MFKALDDFVIVKPVAMQKRPGELYIPETAKRRLSEGTVIAVGIGKLLKNGSRVAPQIKIGDTVFFTPEDSKELILGEAEYLVLRESSIQAFFPTQSSTSV
jgi:chaperonin GroES